MRKSAAVLLILLVLASRALAEPPASLEQIFFLGKMTIRAPRDVGWQILRDSPNGVVLSGNTETVARLAYAHVFAFPPPYDRSSFLSEVKRNVAQQFARPGITLGPTSYEYSETRGYPCVSVRTFADMQEQPNWPQGYKQRLHYRMLLCQAPPTSQLGVLVAFSYSGETSSFELDAQAEEFVNALSTSQPK
jgi:hypothetical protein